jgi:hypothetical protein
MYQVVVAILCGAITGASIGFLYKTFVAKSLGETRAATSENPKKKRDSGIPELPAKWPPVDAM